MMYHAQMAFYDTGAKSNGIDTSKGLYLIGVEDKAPYPVTVLRLTAETLDAGKRACALWLERLRMCQDSDQWPGYTQSVVDFVLPDWMGVGSEDE